MAQGFGDQIAWGESNAVVFANSVLGARTQKYADFLDVCAALTARILKSPPYVVPLPSKYTRELTYVNLCQGRAPFAGPHTTEKRRATLHLDVTDIFDKLLLPRQDCGNSMGDATIAALGYLCGLRSAANTPVITGLERLKLARDELKAFAAAFGTSASAPMFHIVGVTPEAADLASAAGGKSEETPPLPKVTLYLRDLALVWQTLDNGYDGYDGYDAAEVEGEGDREREGKGEGKGEGVRDGARWGGSCVGKCHGRVSGVQKVDTVMM
jgi:predicted aconitase